MSLSTPNLLAPKDWCISLLDIPCFVTINQSEHHAWTVHTPGISLLHLAFKMLSWNPSEFRCFGHQQHWTSRLYGLSHSVESYSLWSHGQQPARSSVHRDSLGKNTGVGCHFLLQRIWLTQVKPAPLKSSALVGGFFTASTTWEAQTVVVFFLVELLGFLIYKIMSPAKFYFFLSNLQTFAFPWVNILARTSSMVCRSGKNVLFLILCGKHSCLSCLSIVNCRVLEMPFIS